MTLVSREEDFQKFCPNIHVHGGHHVHVTKTIFMNLCPLLPMRLHKNLALVSQAVLEKMFENNGHTHAYRTVTGIHNPLWSDVFKNINRLSIWLFAASFPFKFLFNSYSHSNQLAAKFDLVLK